MDEPNRASSWTAQASHLALLRWLLPDGPEEVESTASEASAKENRIRVPATSPGQNSLEAYGMAVFLLVWHTLFFTDMLGWTNPGTAVMRALPGFVLAVAWLHLTALSSGFLAGLVKRRWGFGAREASNAFPHRAGFVLTTALALWAIAQGYPLTFGPAILWLLFVTANTWAWFALARSWSLGLLVMAHWSALLLCLFVDWKAGLALLFSSHLVMLWGLLRPGSRLFGRVVKRFPTTKKEVLLTIDDGPCPGDTKALLEVLGRFDAKAIFFLIGQRATAQPQLVEAIVKRGHAVGNHTQRHLHRFFWALPWWTLRREIDETQDALRAITGRAPVWFRSPVGFGNVFLQAILQRRGLRRMGWEARGFDGVAKEPETVLRRLRAGIRPGSIVLLHQGQPQSVEVLEKLLEWLRAESFDAVLPNLVEKEP